MASIRVRSVLMIAPALLVLEGCSTAKGRVFQTESGKLAAIGTAKEEPDARMAALDQADAYCGKKNREPIFPDEEVAERPKKRFGLDALKNLPYIGRVFKSESKSQVTVDFRCARGPVA